MVDIPRIPAAIRRKLGRYVYLYVNPLTKRIFYVGKGQGTRALSHLRGRAKERLAKHLRAIASEGQRPRIEILAHRLPTDEAALAVETAAIEILGLDNLTNSVRGHQAHLSRFTVEDLKAHYTKDQAKIRESALLIRVNRLYRNDMTPLELYDITRSAWTLGAQRNKVKLVLAVYEGVVREVYEPTAWFPAGSTFNHQWQGRRFRRLGHRWEFVGVIAEDRLRRKYLGKYVGHYSPKGSQNPIQYINPR